MGTIEPYMGLKRPTLGGDPGTWDNQNDDNVPLIAQHRHVDGEGVRIPSAGLGIDADLTMAGYSLTNLRAACFTVQASFSTNRSLWVRTSDNALVWRSAAGVDWKLADSSGINVSLVGGIAGDYAAAGASVYYDDTAEAYRFLEATPTPNSWSYVKAGGVDIYEHASGISNFVRLISPAALPASYTWTMPAALPGSTAIAQVSSTGVVTTSNTIVNDLTMTAAKHVVVSSTGLYKHGDRVRSVNGVMGTTSYTAGAATWENSTGYAISVAAGGGFLHLSIPFNEGERVKSLTYARFGNASANNSTDVFIVTAGGSVGSGIGAATDTAPAAAWTDTTINITDTVIGSGETLLIRFNASAANIRIGNVRVTYDQP